MWHFEQPPQFDLADTTFFLSVLKEQHGLFDPATPIHVARAPGRLDLMGGIADYSGALVLELPLAAGTHVAAQISSEPTVLVRTVPHAGFDGMPQFEAQLGEIAPEGGPLDYAAAQQRFVADRARRWAAYVIGALVVLHRECGVRVDRGLRVLVMSDVPLGRGVASSAALEVAALSAIAATCGVRLDGRQVALLAQMVENRIVGAPCGIMDQLTAACGTQDHLLSLLCQPAELQAALPLPPNVEVWGIDSGIEHTVCGTDYTAARVGAFMGYRMIAAHAGLKVQPAGPDRVSVDDPRWGGYLANVTTEEWESEHRSRLPKTMAGAEFLRRYGGTTDTVTAVDPERTYAIWAPTAHPIHEHRRVRQFHDLLRAGEPTPDTLATLGALMYESHASYTACGLGSRGTDQLVELVRAAGPDRGLYGAKITGGGSGGTVAVLAARHAFTEIKHIASTYSQKTGREATIMGGSSPGAVQFGGGWLTAD